MEQPINQTNSDQPSTSPLIPVIVSVILTAIIVGGGIFWLANQKQDKLQNEITSLTNQLQQGSDQKPIDDVQDTPEWISYRDHEYGFEMELPIFERVEISINGDRQFGVVGIDVWDSKGMEFKDFIISQWGDSEAVFESEFTPLTNAKGYQYFKEAKTTRSQYVQRYFFRRDHNYIIVLNFSRQRLAEVGEESVQRIVDSANLNIFNQHEVGL